MRTSYHIGGFKPEAPAENKDEEWNSETGIYTRWDEQGNVIETRPFTSEEQGHMQAQLASARAAVNQGDLKSKALNALSNNVAFLGNSSPTNAQVVAQVRALTRQMNALIKLYCDDLDTTEGT